jgi:hypothetical protein
MITSDMYKNILNIKGRNLSQVRQYNSAMVMNATFTGDIGYKQVYILDKEKGWIYEDAKYSKHATPSILKDAVDYYLQFRPRIHYPVGTYVFIPNDMDYEIGFEEDEPSNPFEDENFDVDKLWMIVGRNDANEFVRYNIIKCNWNFRWIARVNGENKVLNVFGSVRNANSYTSGVWAADYTTSLDNVTNAWLPDTYLLYGDKLSEFNLCDTRYLRHEHRFMLTHNKLDPKVYAVTKVQDLVPQGVIKLTLKQDELDETRDNVDLMLCDYYNGSGEIVTKQESHVDDTAKSFLWSAIIDENGVLQRNREQNRILHIAKISYYNVEFFLKNKLQDLNAEWRIDYNGNSDLSEDEIKHLCDLIVLRQIDKSTISVKPAKTNKLIGEKFILTVQDTNGDYASSIELEVQK